MASATGYSGPACRHCARPFASRYSDTCGDCLSDEPPFERAISYGLYEGVLMEAIHLMKFRGARRLSRPLSGMLSGLDLSRDADIIVPVPMTGAGLKKRGFNQSALVAKALGRARDIPLRLDLLLKIRETPPQLGLSRRARLRNLRGAFSAEPGVKGLNVIVLDDVITTGATMRECASALKKSGATEVTALSIARTY
jgi:ComF family protein